MERFFMRDSLRHFKLNKKYRTISIGNTSFNHWFSRDMLVFRGVSKQPDTGGNQWLFPTGEMLHNLNLKQTPLDMSRIYDCHGPEKKFTKHNKLNTYTPEKERLEPNYRVWKDGFPFQNGLISSFRVNLSFQSGRGTYRNITLDNCFNPLASSPK